MVLPSVRRCHADSSDRDGPRKHPEKVGAKRLDEIPVRGGCEKNRGDLIVQSVEDVTPVNSL